VRPLFCSFRCNLSNGLSLLRAPLALLFLVENIYVRLTAILLAMVTDSVDGYLARRFSSTSQLGAILDPMMDKFFVFFALGVFLIEGRLAAWEAGTLISRDFFLCIFGIYLALSKRWQSYECRSIRWGKITTALQFCVLIALTMHFSVPWPAYSLFFLFGSLAFVELCRIQLT
jgi:CDP-diacylglycerol--glycerol-3-phosphate 3-phosphatidyltransferase